MDRGGDGTEGHSRGGGTYRRRISSAEVRAAEGWLAVFM